MLCSWLSRSLPHTMCKGKASGLKSEKIQVPTTCKVPSNPISAFIVFFFLCTNCCTLFNFFIVTTHKTYHIFACYSKVAVNL
jgi:hypothetical protein